MSQQKNGHMSQTFFKNFDIDTCKNKEAEISSLHTIFSQQSLQIIHQPNADLMQIVMNLFLNLFANLQLSLTVVVLEKQLHRPFATASLK